MSFTLITPHGEPEQFDDDARHSITDRGFLTVTVGDRKRTYSPTGWLYIEEPKPAGGTRGVARGTILR